MHSLLQKQPYLSIVVAARNDDHGGNMLHRIQVCINGLAYQCKKYNLSAELIVVEWNPLPNKKRLSEIIKWPQPLEPLVVRLIEVPEKIHNQIKNSDKIPFFQMIAKNAGIRRAKGEFVLATNIDILFSDELIRFLSEESLDPDCFYRVDRYDVGSKVIPSDIPFEEQLGFCHKNVIRIQGLYGTKKPEEYDIDLREKYNIDLGFKIHDNACGDFTLMARDMWFSLKGYPELPVWSIHIDSLNVHMAYARGLIQVILPAPMIIYHIEHESSWAVTQDLSKKYPALVWGTEVMPLLRRMMEQRRPVDFNEDTWGLAHQTLKEYAIVENTEIAMETIPAGHSQTFSEKNKSIRYNKQLEVKHVSGPHQPITIFTIPKAFNGHNRIIQHNAIKSWTLLKPRPEIIVFGDDEGTSEIAHELDLQHIPTIKRTEFGTPFLNDLFSQAQKIAKNNIIVYVNADIILMSDFMTAVNKANTYFDHFLMIGQRWDSDISEPFDFETPSWEERLRELVSQSGRLQSISAIDYFAFTKDLLSEMPPFAIGRGAWDNWIVYQGLASKHPVINATQAVMVIHQNHAYSHISKVFFDIEISRNRYLAFESFFICPISHATWELTPAGFIQKPLQKKVFSLCTEGVDLLHNGKPSHALERFNEVLRMGLIIPGIHYARAFALVQLSQREEAMKALRHELKFFPYNEKARVLLIQMNPPILPSVQSKSTDVISDIKEYLTLH